MNHKWICWFKNDFLDLLLFLFSLLAWIEKKYLRKKIFRNIFQVYWSKETWFFYFIKYAQKQKQEKDGICEETSYLISLLNFTATRDWLALEISRKKKKQIKGEWTGRSLNREVVNCVNRFRVRFNLFWLRSTNGRLTSTYFRMFQVFLL